MAADDEYTLNGASLRRIVSGLDQVDRLAGGRQQAAAMLPPRRVRKRDWMPATINGGDALAGYTWTRDVPGEFGALSADNLVTGTAWEINGRVVPTDSSERVMLFRVGPVWMFAAGYLPDGEEQWDCLLWDAANNKWVLARTREVTVLTGITGATLNCAASPPTIEFDQTVDSFRVIVTPSAPPEP